MSGNLNKTQNFLHKAVLCLSVELVSHLLLEEKVNPNVLTLDDENWSALHIAVHLMPNETQKKQKENKA